MLIYFIRHGNPCYEPDSLTPRGHYEAEETAKFLLTRNIEKIYSSDSVRAYKTAEHFANLSKKEITKMHWASEYVSGEYFGTMINGYFEFFDTAKQYREACARDQDDPEWYKHKPWCDMRMKEGSDYFDKEIDAWLESMNVIHDREKKEFYAKRQTPESVALFSHGGVGMKFLTSMLDMNLVKFPILFRGFDTCSVTVFEISLEDSHKCRLVTFNKVVYDIDDSIKKEMKV